MTKNPNNKQIENSGKYYSEEGLWAKLASVAKAVGLKGIYMVLQLYNTAMSSDVPAKYRAIIYGALGYFILPIDLVPDVIPVVGFTDDIAALGAAITAASMCITEQIKNISKEQLHKWFGDFDESELE